MPRYHNRYFGLIIEVPEPWTLVSWKTAKIPRAWRPLYQARDDDLPIREDRPKSLFTAGRFAPESRAIIEASLDFSIYLDDPGADFGAAIRDSLEREAREGAWEVGGLLFDYIDTRAGEGHDTVHYRFAYRHAFESYWLYAKVMGDGTERFAEAVTILRDLTWRGGILGAGHDQGMEL